MIGNAHLDPAWLWIWPAGVDEALGTCRTACDLLDEYPDFHVTRGEAWVYERVLTIDPSLFQRIAGHVTAGRWHVVNGWWIQPDCNLPGPESFRRHATIAGRFFQERLGVTVKVGYNVDSFGHCAMIPTFLREAGLEGYVFMRPNAAELPLPSEAFRWRSPAGAEVIGFRISRAYSAVNEYDLALNIESAIAAADRTLGHAMAFYGIGDHGGGPTRIQIEWIRKHRDYGAGVELRFSHPQAFFDAIKDRSESLPCVEGELQHHAVGCYSAVHDIKREVRRAEAMLLEAEYMVTAGGLGKDATVQTRLEEAWKRVLFNQFHDIMGGTGIHPVYAQALDELGFAKSVARDIIVELTRRANVALPLRRRQRIVLDNPTERVWAGLSEYMPWTPMDGSPPAFILEDEAGVGVPHQGGLFPVSVPPGGRRILEISRKKQAPNVASMTHAKGSTLSNDRLSVTCGKQGIEAITLDGRMLLGPGGLRVAVFEDNSDPWSNGVLRYDVMSVATFAVSHEWAVAESGPLRATLSNMSKAADAILQWMVSVDAGSPALRLRLCLHWRGQSCIVKLLVPPVFRVQRRIDGTPGAFLPRPLDGKEYPLYDSLTVIGDNACLTVVSPDITAADVQPDGSIRLTLLRSPCYAQQAPARPRALQSLTDQGVHDFELILLTAAAYVEANIRDEANRLNHPLWVSETTLGMPAGWNYDRPLRPMTEGGTPVIPASAWLAEELATWVAVPGTVSLADSQTVCPEWDGDRVLLSEAPTIRLRLPVPADGRYRLAVAYALGGAFGPAEIRVGGQVVAQVADTRLEAHGKVTVSHALTLTKGETELEFRRQNGTRMAIGAVDLTLEYKDIPSSAWMGIGPFLFGETSNMAALAKANVPTAMKDVVLPPELNRDINSPIALDDGTSIRWRPMADAGDFVDFYRFSGKKDGSIHYAVTHIQAACARVARFSFGMDYWVRIWIDGRVVMPYQEGCSAIVKGNFVFDAELKAGWNEVLVKIASGSAGNGFWLAVADKDDLTFFSPGK